MKTLAGGGAIVPDPNGHTENVLLVKVDRLGMTRWELPTAVCKDGERAEDAACRAVLEESQFVHAARIERPACASLHRSMKNDRTFYGMFFLCSYGHHLPAVWRVPPHRDPVVAGKAKQTVVEVAFEKWEAIPARTFHPLHRLILETFFAGTEEMFLVVGDADREHGFFESGNEDELYQLRIAHGHAGWLTPKLIVNEAKLPIKARVPISDDDANILVEKYLRQNPNATARMVVAETGISLGRIPTIPAWRAQMGRRRAAKDLPKRTPIALTEQMIKSVKRGDNPADVAMAREAAWRKLLEKANGEEKAKLFEMTPEQRDHLIDISLEHFSERLVEGEDCS